jgi:hypothetical protein
MPDLVTHTAAAYFLSRNTKSARIRVFFYMGAVLPDILARPIYILWPDLFFYTVAIHTPAFMIVFILLFAEFFPQYLRKTVAVFTLAGVGLHFLMDLFQQHLLTGYYWLFPFSWNSFEIALFWPETPVRLIPLWTALILATEFVSYIYRRASTP